MRNSMTLDTRVSRERVVVDGIVRPFGDYFDHFCRLAALNKRQITRVSLSSAIFQWRDDRKID